MAFSLAGELSLDTVALELLTGVPLRDSLQALRQALEIINVSEEDTDTKPAVVILCNNHT